MLSRRFCLTVNAACAADPVLACPGHQFLHIGSPRSASPAAGEAAVVSAVRGLPRRQREALVLRHYLSLPDGQIAAVMGISRSAVRVHSARGLAALRRVLSCRQSPPSGLATAAAGRSGRLRAVAVPIRLPLRPPERLMLAGSPAAPRSRPVMVPPGAGTITRAE
ncbi:MAG: sigma factor-like helix-turn-helix DNA-binding protein [Streptosporangiaceae bacterium]